jgi:hypothetical protein
MWLVIVGVLSLVLGILALVGLLVVARELIFERPFEANSMDDESTKGQCDGGRSSGRRCATTR